MCTIRTAHARDLSVGQSVSHFSELQNTNNNKLHFDKMKYFPLIFSVKHNQYTNCPLFADVENKFTALAIINHHVHVGMNFVICIYYR